jgi:hypothetical protein
VTRLEVTINARDPFEVAMESESLGLTEVELPRAVDVKRITLRITGWSKGARHGGLAGFSNVGLERD